MFFKKKHLTLLYRYWSDALACFFLVILFFIFYIPKEPYFQSSYIIWGSGPLAALSFIFNGNNDPSPYGFIEWDATAPFSVIWAKCIVPFFVHSPRLALAVYHISMNVFALSSLYFLSRFFFKPFLAFIIVVLLAFGKTGLPMVRGLGCSWYLCAFPFCYAVILAIAVVMQRGKLDKRKWINIFLGSVGITGLYLLGGHTIPFASVTLVLMLVYAFLSRYLRPSLQSRPLRFAPKAFWLMCLLSLALGIGLQSNLYWSLPKYQQGLSTNTYLMQLTHGRILSTVTSQRSHSLSFSFDERLAMLKALFITGDVGALCTDLSDMQCLPFSDGGFHGLFPLFLIPGFLVGLVLLFRHFLKTPPPPQNIEANRKHLLKIFTLSLFFVFLLIAAQTAGPFLARLNLAFFSLLLISCFGYQAILKWAKSFALSCSEKTRFFESKILTKVPLLLLFFLAAALAWELRDNYQGLDRHLKKFIKHRQFETVQHIKVAELIAKHHPVLLCLFFDRLNPYAGATGAGRDYKNLPQGVGLLKPDWKNTDYPVGTELYAPYFKDLGLIFIPPHNMPNLKDHSVLFVDPAKKSIALGILNYP